MSTIFSLFLRSTQISVLRHFMYGFCRFFVHEIPPAVHSVYLPPLFRTQNSPEAKSYVRNRTRILFLIEFMYCIRICCESMECLSNFRCPHINLSFVDAQKTGNGERLFTLHSGKVLVTYFILFRVLLLCGFPAVHLLQ